MGLGIGLPCCDCATDQQWRVSMTDHIWQYVNYSYPYTFETIIEGAATGFDVGIIDYQLMQLKLELVAGINWDLTLKINGINVETVNFSFDFSAGGSTDVAFDLTLDECNQSRPIVTLMHYPDTRPASFRYFPNRYPTFTNFVLVAFARRNTDVDYGDNLMQETFSVVMTHSSDASYHYWEATEPIEWPAITNLSCFLRASKTLVTGFTNEIRANFTAIGNLAPSTASYPSGSQFWKTTPFNAMFSQDDSFVYYVYDADDPPPIMKYDWSDLMLENESITTYQFEKLSPVAGNGVSGPLFDQAMLRMHAKPYSFGRSIFDTALVLDFWIARGDVDAQVDYQEAYFTIAGDVLFVDVRCLVSEVTIDSGPQTAIYAGQVQLPIVGGVVDDVCRIHLQQQAGQPLIFHSPIIPITATIAETLTPAGCWSDPLQQRPKIFYPLYYTDGPDDPSAGFNWRFDSSKPRNDIQVLTSFTVPSFQFSFYILTQLKVIDGALPSGLNLVPPLGDFFGNRPFSLEGDIAVGAGSGFVQFELTTSGYADKFVTSRYYWEVDEPGFVLSYPAVQYSNSATGTPPSIGKEFRFEPYDPFQMLADVRGGVGAITFAQSGDTLPAPLALNTSTGEIEWDGVTATIIANHIGSTTITATDSTAATATYVLNWEYRGTEFSISYPDNYANHGTGILGIYEWVIVFFLPDDDYSAYSIPVTVVGGIGAITFAILEPGPPTTGAINPATGDIDGFGTVSTTGICQARATDSVGNVADSPIYDWITLGVTSPFTIAYNDLPYSNTGVGPSSGVDCRYDASVFPFPPNFDDLLVTATGNVGAVTYAVTGGSLTPGLSLNTGTGAITEDGPPYPAGDSTGSVTITGTDSTANTASTSFDWEYFGI